MLAPAPFADAALAVVAASAQAARRLSAAPPGTAQDSAQELVRSGLAGGCLPDSAGGVGLATDPGHVLMLLESLRSVARADLETGRLFEAHVRAVQLLHAHAPDRLRVRATSLVKGGRLLALWRGDQDTPACPGAGAVAAALVATRVDGQTQVTWLERPHCMGAVMPVPDDRFAIPAWPEPGWTALAVRLGGIEALAEALRQHARAQPGTGTGPVTEAVEAAEAARLWVQQAALLAEDTDIEAEAVLAHMALARRAVARATEGAIAAAAGADLGATRIARTLADAAASDGDLARDDRAGRLLLHLERPVGEAWM